MSEIADDHQSIIAEQAAYNYGFGLSNKRKSEQAEESKVDWVVYFERNRRSTQESVVARANFQTKQGGVK